jgi:hypothetical protein
MGEATPPARPLPPIDVQLACPRCRGPVSLAIPGAGEAAACARCGEAVRARVTDAMRDARVIDSCPVCGGEDLYVQKDFNRKIGVGIVIVGCALAPFTPFYSSLFAAAAIDFLLYLLLPFCTVCYECKSVIRGNAKNPAHAAFDIHVHERYRRTA